GYVFRARSNARRTRATRSWPWKYAVEIADGYRLPRVVTLDELRAETKLRRWAFVRHQRGVVNRRADLEQQGWWHPLSRLLEQRAPGLRNHFGPTWTGGARARRVFLSYCSRDRRRVLNFYGDLVARGVDVWLDRVDLEPGAEWEREITAALRAS